MRIWDAATGKFQKNFTATSFPTGAAFSPKHPMLALAFVGDCTIQIADLITDKTIKTPKVPMKNPAGEQGNSQVCFSYDGNGLSLSSVVAPSYPQSSSSSVREKQPVRPPRRTVPPACVMRASARHCQTVADAEPNGTSTCHDDKCSRGVSGLLSYCRLAVVWVRAPKRQARLSPG